MNNSIFTIGMIVLVIGVVAVVLSAFGDLNIFPIDSENRWTITLIVLGILVLIVGAAMPSVSSSESTSTEPTRTHKRTKTIIREE